MTYEEIERENAGRDRRLIERLEPQRRNRIEAVARAERTLREANLRDFRAAMQALFEAHPALDTVRLDQVSQYNDEFVDLDIRDLWVNGRHVRTEAGVLDGYNRGSAPSPYSESDWDAYALLVPSDETDEMGYPTARPPEVSPAEDLKALVRAQREELGDVYKLAHAALGALRSLAERYGAPFFWDLFGAAAAVRVDRESIQVSSDVWDADAYRERSRSQNLEWVRDHLGHTPEAYLTSPERGGAAGVRAAYTHEIERIERALVSARLRLAASEIRLAHRGASVGRLSLDTHADRVQSVAVGGEVIRVWDRSYWADATPLTLPVRGVEGDYARRPAATPEDCERALRREVPGAVADATLEWLRAIDAVRADYGLDVLRRLHPSMGPTYSF